MKTRILLVAGLLASSGGSWAQTACPNGVPPGSPQCGPSPSYHGVTPPPSPQPTQPQAPLFRWVDRWGAVAWDNSGYIQGEEEGIGIASAQTSQSKAKKKALEECRAAGGSKKGCEVIFVLRNGCMAMAKGASGVRSPHSADTLEQAMQSALGRCGADTSGCAILFSACSLPVRERCTVFSALADKC